MDPSGFQFHCPCSHICGLKGYNTRHISLFDMAPGEGDAVTKALERAAKRAERVALMDTISKDGGTEQGKPDSDRTGVLSHGTW